MEWVYILNGLVAALSLWTVFFCIENDNEFGAWMNFIAFSLNISMFIKHFWW